MTIKGCRKLEELDNVKDGCVASYVCDRLFGRRRQCISNGGKHSFEWLTRYLLQFFCFPVFGGKVISAFFVCFVCW